MNYFPELSRTTHRLPNLFGDHFLTSVFDEFFTPTTTGKSKSDFFGKARYPYNLYVRDDETTVIEFALAGFSKNEIKVEVIDTELQIRASKKRKTDEVEDNSIKEQEGNASPIYYVQQLTHQDLDIKFTLNQRSDAENIKVLFENGLLTIEIPKIPESKRILEIK
jgi:HSP20 family molecular chaperone IbpA